MGCLFRTDRDAQLKSVTTIPDELKDGIVPSSYLCTDTHDATPVVLPVSPLFFIRTILYKNIEPQICSKMFPKTTKNSKFKHGNLSNKNLEQEKHIIGIGVKI